MATSQDWHEFLTGRNLELLARYRELGTNAFVDDLVTPEVVASGWLLGTHAG